MDLIQTLLTYLTVTAALAVQAAPTPEVTPVPTATPESAAVESLSPEMTAAVIGSIVVTAPPPTEEPVPTITPNKAYKNVQYGDRGTQVKAVQQRLIELGYLNGNADGAFGYQTRRAVIDFQRNNGLVADGVAGEATQTRLFEDPQVVPNPDVMTPSPEPTATPDAAGLIPVPEEPRSIWVGMVRPTVLLNGQVLTLPGGGSLHVWMRGSEIIVSLSELASAAESWSLTDEGASAMTLLAEGYSLQITMTEAAKSSRSTDAAAYCDSYQALSGERTIETSQGDLMYENGEWFATEAWLERAFVRSDVVWDSDEQHLVLILPERQAAESPD